MSIPAVQKARRRWHFILLYGLLPWIFASCIGDCGDDEAPSICATCECESDEDCGDLSPFATCTSTSFACVIPPPFDDECSETESCDFGDFCSLLTGNCFSAAEYRDCTRRSECPQGQLCDRTANKCIPVDRCFTDEFCDVGEFCDVAVGGCKQIGTRCTFCESDGDCPAESPSCLSQGECAPSPEAAACRTGELCSSAGRCIQCETTADCGTGLYCNGSSGRCESAVQCRGALSACPRNAEFACITCDAPLACDARTLTCAAPARACETDLNCEPEEFCDETQVPPICIQAAPECINDPLEGENGNDVASQATAVDLSSLQSLELCPGDVDWFSVDLPAGTELRADFRFSHAEGDLDAALYAADGSTLLARAESVTDNERLVFQAGTEVRVLIRAVLVRPTAEGLRYDLSLSSASAALCVDEAEEDNDLPAEAKELALVEWQEGRLCAGDLDWWQLPNLSAGDRLTVELDHVASLGNLNLEIYRTDRTLPIAVSQTDEDLESVQLDVPATEDYLVKVTGTAADQNIYRLRASVEPGVLGCTDDVLEPNDSVQTATTATSGLLSLCAGEEDWFVLPPAPGGIHWAEIAFARELDLELSLFEQAPGTTNLQEVQRSNGTSPREYVSARAGSATRFLRVYGHTPADFGDYELYVRTTTTANCAPDEKDRLGVANTRADATPVNAIPFVDRNQSICGVDEDWYTLAAQPGFAYLLRTQSLLPAEIQLDVSDLLGNPIASTQTVVSRTGERSLVLGPVVAPVSFGIQVRTTGLSGAYDFTVDQWAAFSCEADRYEPNATTAEASNAVATATAAPFVETDLTLCANDRVAGQGDEDVFALRPQVGDVVRAQIQFSTSDLSLELLSPSGNRACFNTGESERCFSDGYDTTENVVFTATTAEPYFLRVSSVFGSPFVASPPESDASYQLSVSYE